MNCVPTSHQLRAAITVARIIDQAGDRGHEVRTSYPHLLTAGEHSPASLAAGEELLIRVGLVVDRHGSLYPTARLAVLVNLADDAAEDALRAALARAESDRRAEIGDAGERVVIAACQDDLRFLGQHDLAEQVQQVSLLDDGLGYDVLAPAIAGSPRLMEVKTSSRKSTGTFDFYLTRNEFDVGRRHHATWSLVACEWSAGRAALLGWCRAAVLTTYLPADANGRWTEAAVGLPRSLLTPGVPSAV